MTQAEAAQHFGVSRHCIWNALHKMGWTREKNDRLQRAQPEATKTIPAPSGAVRSARSAARPHRWSKFGGMTVPDIKRLKVLEQENTRLKKLLAEALLEQAVTHEALRKKW
jgi:putative transposase